MSRLIPNPRLGQVPFGIWLHSLAETPDRDSIRVMVERMVTQGVDILFACVKQTSGEVDYPSNIAPQSTWSLGTDPLQLLTETAQEFALKLHAWFCVFPEGDRSRLLAEHPEYRAIQNHPYRGVLDTPDKWGANMRWSCANRPEVRDYHYAVMA